MSSRTKTKSYSAPHEPANRIDGPVSWYVYQLGTSSCTSSMYQLKFPRWKRVFLELVHRFFIKEKINIFSSLNKTDVPAPKEAVFNGESWYIELVQELVPSWYMYQPNHAQAFESPMTPMIPRLRSLRLMSPIQANWRFSLVKTVYTQIFFATFSRNRKNAQKPVTEIS